MTHFFQIEAFPKNTDAAFIFDKYENKFKNHADLNTQFKTEEEAQDYIELARAAWNEEDAIEIVRVDVEEDE